MQFKTRNRARWVLLAATIWSVTSQALAQEATTALAQVPADAPLVIHVRGFERTKDRLMTLIKNAVPDLAPMVQARMDEAMKEGLDGRELKGLPKHGSIFVVFTELPKPGEDEPAAAVIVAVTDFKAFRDGYMTADERKTIKEDKAAGYETATVRDKEVFMIDRKGFAVITMQKEVAAKLAKKDAGLASTLPKETAKKLLESDAAVYVDMAAVNKEFGDQIKAFRPLIEFGLQQGGAQMDKATLDMVKAMFNGFFQLVEDCRGLVLAVDFRPEGLATSLEARVGADTKINAFLKGAKPGTLDAVDRLTAGRMTYTVGALDSELFKAFGPFLQGMMGGSDGALGSVYQEYFKQLTESGPQTMAAEMTSPSRSLSVWTYRDPVKASAALLKMLTALQKGESYGNVPLREKPVIKEAAQTYRDFKLNSVSLKWDFDKLAEKAAQAGGKDMAEAMKILMGDGTNVWFGTDGKAYVQITTKDWDSAKQELDAYLDGKDQVGKHTAFQEARKQLPTQATLLTFVDAPQYVQMMSEFMGPILKAQGLPIALPAMKSPKGKSFVGLAVSLQPERGAIEFWLPVTTVQEVRKMVEPLIGAGAIQ